MVAVNRIECEYLPLLLCSRHGVGFLPFDSFHFFYVPALFAFSMITIGKLKSEKKNAFR